MSTLDHPRTMAAYNRWMNEQLYAVCAQLDDDRRKRDSGAYFHSIHGTLNHLLLADRLWLGRFRHQPFAIRSLDQELCADFDELSLERVKTDTEIIDWVADLTEDDLASPFQYASFVNPREYTYPLWLLVVHFFNHQTHHRGQLTTLLSQCDLEPGVTDLIHLPGLFPPPERED